MRKLSDVRFPREEEVESLKDLWHISFGDDYDYIDEFFERAFNKENTLVISDGDKVVSALYLIESHVVKDEKIYNAYYVYAVATLPSYRGKGLMASLLRTADDVAMKRNVSYLFLVPGEESLYEMYKKFGYGKCFYFKEKVVEKKNLSYECEKSDMNYDLYLNCRREYPLNEAVVFCEDGYNIFVSPRGEDVKSIYVENVGYCVYEKMSDGVTVWELFGDEDILLNEVFKLSEADTVRLRKFTSQGGIPCGMYKAFGDAPKIESAFIGAYGG